MGALRGPWRQLDLCGETLRLERVLQRGMAFRWKELEPGRQWAGVIRDRLVVLRQDGDTIDYLVEADAIAFEEELQDYFNLGIRADDLIKEFVAKDNTYAAVAEHTRGTRPLRIHPVECLFSFICSANNNIPRITQMVNFLADQYGENVGEYEGQSFHRFPTIAELCNLATEDELRTSGFGYRAKYIVGTAEEIRKRGGEKWLDHLRARKSAEAHGELCELPGIGKKVASCIALFSLDKFDSVPIDTHIWKLTTTKYLPRLGGKTLTPRVYDEIGSYYRDLFGDYAGWAHTVLFGAQLDAARGGGPGSRTERLDGVKQGGRRRAGAPKRTSESPARRPTTRSMRAKRSREELKAADQGPPEMTLENIDAAAAENLTDASAELRSRSWDAEKTLNISQVSASSDDVDDPSP